MFSAWLVNHRIHLGLEEYLQPGQWERGGCTTGGKALCPALVGKAATKATIYSYLGDIAAANLLTVTDLALHEGGRGQACADGVTEAALGVQALAGTALTQCSGAEVHVLCWRL